jgi:hypothetical protein
MAGGVAHGVGPEFKPQYCKIKQKNIVQEIADNQSRT